MGPRRRPLRTALLVLAGIVAACAALFLWTGLNPAWRTPESGGAAVEQGRRERLRVFAINLAKLGFHRGGLRFASQEEVLERLESVAEAIRRERADLVFLSEVVWEAGPEPTNQVTELARRTGLSAYAYGDNYRFGLPFLRIRTGNAILSRYPLRAREVQQLVGARPFYAPTNNRRILWCELELGEETVLVGSVRNDSFDLANNARQAQQILERLDARPALLAGDFNAEPQDEAMQLFAASGRFARFDVGDATFPAGAPRRRIDYVLAPSSWETVELRTVGGLPSDHLAVSCELKLPSP